MCRFCYGRSYYHFLCRFHLGRCFFYKFSQVFCNDEDSNNNHHSNHGNTGCSNKDYNSNCYNTKGCIPNSYNSNKGCNNSYNCNSMDSFPTRNLIPILKSEGSRSTNYNIQNNTANKNCCNKDNPKKNNCHNRNYSVFLHKFPSRSWKRFSGCLHPSFCCCIFGFGAVGFSGIVQ